MRPVAPPPIPAEVPQEGHPVPPWAYRSEAFAEDFDEPDASDPSRPASHRRSVWPWAVGVPVLVLALGLVAAFHG